MKSEWDKRAEKNAYHYVSTFRKEWDDESFFEWGEFQTRTVIDRFLQDRGFNPYSKTVLEIGCGAGRLSRAFSSRFKNVYSYDVSDRYIQIAKEKNGHLENVTFRVNDGLSFPEIQDGSIDFVFSGWTMLHMPTREVVIANIREIARILSKNGLYKIDPKIVKFARAREFIKSKFVIPIILPLFENDKLKTTPTYTGITFSEKEMTRILLRAGLTVNTLIEEDGSESYRLKRIMRRWFWGKKSFSVNL